MEHERLSPDDPTVESAIAEIKALVTARYPDALFEVSEGDDPEGIYLLVTVDLEDVDEVMDLYTERLVELQVEDHVPLYVISLQPIERVVADLEAERTRYPEPKLPRPVT